MQGDEHQRCLVLGWRPSSDGQKLCIEAVGFHGNSFQNFCFSLVEVEGGCGGEKRGQSKALFSRRFSVVAVFSVCRVFLVNCARSIACFGNWF